VFPQFLRRTRVKAIGKLVGQLLMLQGDVTGAGEERWRNVFSSRSCICKRSAVVIKKNLGDVPVLWNRAKRLTDGFSIRETQLRHTQGVLDMLDMCNATRRGPTYCTRLTEVHVLA
jgi:hypothetical protein